MGLLLAHPENVAPASQKRAKVIKCSSCVLAARVSREFSFLPRTVAPQCGSARGRREQAAELKVQGEQCLQTLRRGSRMRSDQIRTGHLELRDVTA